MSTMFIVGLLGFAIASAAGGAAPNIGTLIVARAVQGGFAAVLAPAALSLITVIFTDRKELNKAFGIFGAVSGSAGAVGLLLAGFVVLQKVVRHPLIPLRVVADRNRGAAYLTLFLANAAVFALYLTRHGSTAVVGATVHRFTVGYWWAAGVFWAGAVLCSALIRGGTRLHHEAGQPEPLDEIVSGLI
jgi:MFS family permease